MTIRVAQAPEAAPTRTRICGTQSKYGCFTCKYVPHRMNGWQEKADGIGFDASSATKASRPACVALAHTASAKAILPEPLTNKLSRARVKRPHQQQVPNLAIAGPTSSLIRGCVRSPQDRLARLGCSVLGHNAFTHFGSSSSVLEILLPQLTNAIHSVNVAATALGAVCELQNASMHTSRDPETSAASFYLTALRAVQHDLRAQPHGPVPLIVVCMLLACIEVLLHRQQDALLHLRGAFQLIKERRNARAPNSLPASQAGVVDTGTFDDDLELLFRTLDFQTTSFALILNPEIPPPTVSPTTVSMSNLCSARINLVLAVHASYHFTARAYKLRYCPRLVRGELLVEQGRHIAQLSLWLEMFERAIPASICRAP